KDHATLIRASQGLTGCRVLFVGGGPNGPKMEAISRELGTTGHVEFLGERCDILDLLAGSHIFVLATHWEGLPISIQEAMRAGLPVVATDVDGVKEEVIDGETGRLVPHKDPEALRAVLLELMGDPELRARMGRAGRARWEQEFSLEAMLAKTDVVYRGGSLGR
ncbi:MAG TPA: glycosyltransferase, partial [Armatimonadota bacterium]